MSNIADTRVKSGWYPDPMGDNDLRWWDGEGWTEHTLAESSVPSNSRGASTLRIENGSGRSAGLVATDAPDDASDDAYATRHESTPLPSRRQLRAQWEAELGAVEAPARGDVPEITPATLNVPEITPATLSIPTTLLAAAPARTPLTLVPQTLIGAGPEVPSTRPAPLAPLAGGGRPVPLAPLAPATRTETTPAFSHLVAVPERGAFVPFATQAPWRGVPAARPLVVNTLSVWLLVLIPFLYPIALVTVIFSLDVVIPTVQLGIGAIMVLWMVLLVVRDSRELRAAGHDKVASPAWILLTPPAYLLARAIRVHGQTGRGFAPFVTWMILSGAVVAAALAAPALLSIWN